MKLAVILVLFLASVGSHAQTWVDTSYQVEVTATACPIVSFFRFPRVPGGESKTSVGYGGSLRVLWHPGRLLSIGVLTGYFDIAQDEISIPPPATDLSYHASLTAVPLQIALTMRKYGLEIGVEIGSYLMMSTIAGGNSATSHGSRLELSLTIFGSYLFPLNDFVEIGPELRVVSLRYRGIFSVMPSFSCRFIPVRY
jgi:hypothetical protein